MKISVRSVPPNHVFLWHGKAYIASSWTKFGRYAFPISGMGLGQRVFIGCLAQVCWTPERDVKR